ncbi:haloacid dehalogenase [Thiocystis minor]|uniref:HAD family hydrolase n=1 Tax=Thiocystis minor TaxID=61597 RepID=UPI00191278C5|nr:HAD family hydrolase [Thiocystis minor]MBK5965710.1 haloacid dehalogenase [Thiocystis minor]
MPDSLLRLVTCDLDDTLWPCLPVIQAAEQALQVWLQAHAPRLAKAHDVASLRQHRRRIMDETPAIAHDLGQVRHRSLTMLLHDFGYPVQLADAAMDLFLEHRNRVEPYADVLPALRSLAADYCLVSLTNGNSSIEATSLRGLFRHRLTAAEVGAAKPDPAMFRRALELSGCRPTECLHLGDDPWMDVEAARAIGLTAVWVNRTSRIWPEALAPPILTVTNLAEVTDWLHRQIHIQRNPAF